MTLDGFLSLTRQRIGTLAIILLVCTLTSLGAAAATPVTYTASGVAYLRVNVPIELQDTDSYYAATQMAFRKIDAVIPVFTSEAVGNRVVESLGLDATAAQIAGSLKAEHRQDTVTVTISATAPSAQEAQRIADEAIHQAAEEVRYLEGESSPVEIVLMSSATLASTSRSPALSTYLAIGVLAGLVVGYAWIVFRETSDKSLRIADDVRAVLNAPVLGVLTRSRSIPRGAPGQELDRRTEEQLRALRTNVRHTGAAEHGRILVVTATRKGEGSSTVAAHLARVLALAGQQVVLVEGDLRAPGMADSFGLAPRSRGLAGLLEDTETLDEAMHPTPVPGLSLIPAGGTPSNPSELLGSPEMRELLRNLAGERLVIVDSPPVLRLTDAAVIAEQADGVLLVVRAGRTRADDVADAVLAIGMGGGTLRGVILNRAPSPRAGRRPLGAIDAGVAASRVGAARNGGIIPESSRSET